MSRTRPLNVGCLLAIALAVLAWSLIALMVWALVAWR